jgi:hypothetical protein
LQPDKHQLRDFFNTHACLRQSRNVSVQSQS